MCIRLKISVSLAHFCPEDRVYLRCLIIVYKTCILFSLHGTCFSNLSNNGNALLFPIELDISPPMLLSPSHLKSILKIIFTTMICCSMLLRNIIFLRPFLFNQLKFYSEEGKRFFNAYKACAAKQKCF